MIRSARGRELGRGGPALESPHALTPNRRPRPLPLSPPTLRCTDCVRERCAYPALLLTVHDAFRRRLPLRRDADPSRHAPLGRGSSAAACSDGSCGHAVTPPASGPVTVSMAGYSKAATVPYVSRADACGNVIRQAVDVRWCPRTSRRRPRSGPPRTAAPAATTSPLDRLPAPGAHTPQMIPSRASRVISSDSPPQLRGHGRRSSRFRTPSKGGAGGTYLGPGDGRFRRHRHSRRGRQTGPSGRAPAGRRRRRAAARRRPAARAERQRRHDRRGGARTPAAAAARKAPPARRISGRRERRPAAAAAVPPAARSRPRRQHRRHLGRRGTTGAAGAAAAIPPG